MTQTKPLVIAQSISPVIQAKDPLNMDTTKDQYLSITVYNQSGDKVTYGLFTAAPTVNPSPSAPISCRIICVFRHVASPSSQLYFTMPKGQLYALCGTSNRDGLKDGVQIEILDRQAVTLGRTELDGTLVKGTTCEMRVGDGALSFVHMPLSSPSGKAGAFCINTIGDFSTMDARHGNYVLGLGLSTSLSREVGPYVTFRPAPSTPYQIIPSNKFFLVRGDCDPRDVVDQALEKLAFPIDFDVLGTDDVRVVHHSNGTFAIQQSPST